MSNREITVVAGVLQDSTGRVLVSKRPAGKHMAGTWEFPGGKLKIFEPRGAGLARELLEELGIEVESARPLIRYKHQYPELKVDLDVWRVTRWQGEVESLEDQALQWCQLSDLPMMGLLSADLPIITALQLPDIISVTPPVMTADTAFVAALERAETLGGLICVRQTDMDTTSLLALTADIACKLEEMGTKLLLHGAPAELLAAINRLPTTLRARLGDVVAGLHIPARLLASTSVDPHRTGILLGASCHNARELERAVECGATYAFLGNVLETASHPSRRGIGWDKFSELIKDLPLPVYAIGGVGPDDLETAWAAGAQGVAGISAFWPK